MVLSSVNIQHMCILLGDIAECYVLFVLLVIITSTKEVMFLSDFVCLSVCLSVCEQDDLKSYGRIFLKFGGKLGMA